MGTIEVSQLLSYLVPALVAYNIWLHNQIVKSQIEIAVNTSKDNDIIKQFDELKAEVKALAKEIHEFILQQHNSNGK